MLWLALQFPFLGLEVRQRARAAESAGAGTTGEPVEEAGETGETGETGKTEKTGAAEPPMVLLQENRVVLGNAPARRAGIRAGATLATAHSITRDLLHFHRDESRELARLRFLGGAVYRFSAQVSLEAPDALVAEIGGSLALFGNARVLAEQAVGLCESLGHATRWQIAPTPGAALAMASAGVGRLEEVPLAHARLPHAGRTLERLANMGLHTLGALLELPDLELSRRFGPEMAAHLARLTGRAPDPRPFMEPPQRFDQALHLLTPVQNRDDLLHHPRAPMQRLLGELERWLVSRQLGAEQLIWSFSTHDGKKPVLLPVSLSHARQSRRAFLDVIRLRLEPVALPDDILSIRLQAARLVPWPGGSRTLFRLHPGQAADGTLPDPAAHELIDQLRARLGDGACRHIALRDQHAPEAAWQPARASTRPPAPASSAPPRPLWLFDPPCAVQPRHLALLKGPERIRTGWWRRALQRDYYVARLESGATCWAFVDARDRWFLHGYFG